MRSMSAAWSSLSTLSSLASSFLGPSRFVKVIVDEEEDQDKNVHFASDAFGLVSRMAYVRHGGLDDTSGDTGVTFIRRLESNMEGLRNSAGAGGSTLATIVNITVNGVIKNEETDNSTVTRALGLCGVVVGDCLDAMAFDPQSVGAGVEELAKRLQHMVVGDWDEQSEENLCLPMRMGLKALQGKIDRGCLSDDKAVFVRVVGAPHTESEVFEGIM